MAGPAVLRLVALAALAALAAPAAPVVGGEASLADQVALLLGRLGSGTRSEARDADRELEGLCHRSGRPGAEAERRDMALALAAGLAGDLPPAASVIVLEHLAQVGRAEVVAPLGKLLGDGAGDPAVREAARRALEANPAVSAKRELRKAVAVTEGALKVGVIRSLGVRRDFLSAGDIMEAARAKDPDVRLAAVEALAEIGEISATADIEAALETFTGERLRAAKRAYLRFADALVGNGERGEARRIYLRAEAMGPEARAAALVGVARAGLQSEIERIAAATEDADRRVRGAALEAAAILSGPKMTEVLAARLAAASDPGRRLEILGALSRREDAGALAVLEKAIAAEKDPTARARALDLLSGSPPARAAALPESIPALLLAELRAGGEPAAAAERLLAELPSPALTARVAAALEDAGAGAEERQALVRVLGLRRLREP